MKREGMLHRPSEGTSTDLGSLHVRSTGGKNDLGGVFRADVNALSSVGARRRFISVAQGLAAPAPDAVGALQNTPAGEFSWGGIRGKVPPKIPQ